MAKTSLSPAFFFYSILLFSVCSLSQVPTGKAKCRKEGIYDMREPSGRCVLRAHCSKAESYILFTIKHVAIFSYRGKQHSIIANAVYRVF